MSNPSDLLEGTLRCLVRESRGPNLSKKRCGVPEGHRPTPWSVKKRLTVPRTGRPFLRIIKRDVDRSLRVGRPVYEETNQWSPVWDRTVSTSEVLGFVF